MKLLLLFLITLNLYGLNIINISNDTVDFKNFPINYYYDKSEKITIETELTHHEVYETRAEANQSIFEYIEVFYNRERMHSTNNNLSPVEFEEFMLQNEMAA